MNIIRPSVEFMKPVDGQAILQNLERIGRVCYKSEDKITDGSAEKFVRRIIKSGHESVIEHESITVKFICDRGVSHELVRHRIASYSQESTRYCNYAGEGITVVEPCWLEPETNAYKAWKLLCATSEGAYVTLLEKGCSPQEARAVLPNSLKTEVVMTANLREWRHFFRLRCSPAAHPQMREVAMMALRMFREKVPVVFDDVGEEVSGFVG